MATAVIKRLRGYLAPALLTYTIFVTLVLVLTAWNDDVTLGKNAISNEKRRYLPTLDDIGGYRNAHPNGMDRSLSNYGREKFMPVQNGRRVQSSLSKDLYVDDIDSNSNSNNNNNSTLVGGNSSGNLIDGLYPPGGRDYILESRLYKPQSDNVGRRNNFANAGDRNVRPNNTNIQIEEMILIDDDDEDPPPNKNNYNSNRNDNSNSNNNNNRKDKHVLKFQHSFKNNKAGEGGRGEGGGLSKNNAGDRHHVIESSGFPEMQFCDNVEEDGQLCYRDRITFSHPKHVNISSTHQSFRSLGGLQIFSAFVDPRQTPSTIRIMAIGPKGFTDGPSSLWCAFLSPLSVSRRHALTGQGDNIARGRTQASQLHFYAASDGHGKEKQFYVMSCQVPHAYLNTLTRLDGNRIDIIAGSQDNALLDTIQERMPITVINNMGLSWEALREQALERQRRSVNTANAGDDNDGQKDPAGVMSKPSSDSGNDSNDNGIEKGSLLVEYLDKMMKSDTTISEKFPQSEGKAAEISVKAFESPSGGRDAIVSCVAPIYGVIGLVQITEFIELTVLLGVQHIVFYMHKATPDVRQLLSMYKNQGLVTVLPWNIPDSGELWAKGRDVALNDCLYRTMFRYDFAFFQDMDELLVPRATPDLPSLLSFLRTKGKLNTTKISDIVFNSAYFPPPTKAHSTNLTTMPGYTKDASKFISLRSLHRTYFSSQHTLRIIKPIAALRVGAGERKRTTFYINPRFAAVNHYTKCPAVPAAEKPGSPLPKNGQTPLDCNHLKWDDTLWKFKDKLVQNTKDSIRALNAQGRTNR